MGKQLVFGVVLGQAVGEVGDGPHGRAGVLEAHGTHLSYLSIIGASVRQMSL